MTAARSLVWLLAAFIAFAPTASDVRDILVRSLRFTPAELVALRRGRVVRHTIPTTVPGEIVVVGGVRIAVAKTVFLDGLRDIKKFKRNEDVLQIGRFSDPPVAADLDALTVDQADFDVTTCTVGDCGIRLPADRIRQMQRDADPHAPGAQERGARLFKGMLLDDVRAYWTGAPGRMSQYDDGDQPIRPLDEFRGLLERTPPIGALAPGLPEHLADFPARRLENAEDFLYWSKERFGGAPFITVTHVTIVCPSAPLCVATTKDVYSSRYFDASLALTIAMDAPDNPDAFDLIYLNRSRANALKGMLSSLRRMIVERRTRSSVEDNLRTMKARLEQSHPLE